MAITRTAVKLVGSLVLGRPLYAQLIVTRRCNLSCGYCDEYDDRSPPVPLSLLLRRIDALHRLGAFHICMMGGEPLMHPEIDHVVMHASRRAQVSITTNGFLLSDALLRVAPDRSLYIQKTLKTLRTKLERLKARGEVRQPPATLERARPCRVNTA